MLIQRLTNDITKTAALKTAAPTSAELKARLEQKRREREQDPLRQIGRAVGSAKQTIDKGIESAKQLPGQAFDYAEDKFINPVGNAVRDVSNKAVDTAKAVSKLPGKAVGKARELGHEALLAGGRASEMVNQLGSDIKEVGSSKINELTNTIGDAKNRFSNAYAGVDPEMDALMAMVEKAEARENAQRASALGSAGSYASDVLQNPNILAEDTGLSDLAGILRGVGQGAGTMAENMMADRNRREALDSVYQSASGTGLPRMLGNVVRGGLGIGEESGSRRRAGEFARGIYDQGRQAYDDAGQFASDAADTYSPIFSNALSQGRDAMDNLDSNALRAYDNPNSMVEDAGLSDLANILKSTMGRGQDMAHNISLRNDRRDAIGRDLLNTRQLGNESMQEDANMGLSLGDLLASTGSNIRDQLSETGSSLRDQASQTLAKMQENFQNADPNNMKALAGVGGATGLLALLKLVRAAKGRGGAMPNMAVA